MFSYNYYEKLNFSWRTCGKLFQTKAKKKIKFLFEKFTKVETNFFCTKFLISQFGVNRLKVF